MNLKFPPIVFSVLIGLLIPLQGITAVLCLHSAEKDGLSLREINLEMNSRFFLTNKSKLSYAWESLVKAIEKDLIQNPELINKETKQTEKYLRLRIEQISESLKLSEDMQADLLLLLSLDTSIPRSKSPGPIGQRVLPKLNISYRLDTLDLRMELDPAISVISITKENLKNHQLEFTETMKIRAVALTAAKLLAELNTEKSWKNLGLLYLSSKEDLRNSPNIQKNGFNSFFYDLTKIAMTHNRLDQDGRKKSGLNKASEVLESIMNQQNLPLEKALGQIDEILLDIVAANMGA
ncbi:MAG: hypothetical protein VX642_07540 [Bdellovibrionota bacterium]|nr:hypothetical protein [Bdellovibrionota bacterium]